ncbi:MAG TPA: hypothetical protein V6C76_03205 [Drouetiella sp.]
MILILKTLTGCAIAFGIAYPIARASVQLTGVPSSFPPFTALPILSGAVVGPIAAAIIYATVRHFNTVDPDRTFFFITLFAFALSLLLPLRLSFTQSMRFTGVTPSAQMVLVLMHAIVAASTFVALTYKAKLN